MFDLFQWGHVQWIFNVKRGLIVMDANTLYLMRRHCLRNSDFKELKRLRKVALFSNIPFNPKNDEL